MSCHGHDNACGNHSKAHIVVRRDPDAVAQCSAWMFSEIVSHCITARGRCSVALSGGSTPRRLFEMLATPQFREQIDWTRLHVFWSDERFVAPTDPQSNFRMANEALLSHVPIPPQNIHRVQTEVESPEAAAADYERVIRESFGANGQFPRFDLVLLGLGTNGHTASLFPHRPSLNEQSRLVVADLVEEVDQWRITMTAPLLNHARAIAFITTGGDKAEVLHEVLIGPADPERLPAQLIRPVHGFITWVIDEAAASKLPHEPAEPQPRTA